MKIIKKTKRPKCHFIGLKRLQKQPYTAKFNQNLINAKIPLQRLNQPFSFEKENEKIF